jgi:antitoxin component YwqK of YwqJK toxin-antitoxin module
LFRQSGSLQAEGMYMSSRKLNDQGEPMRLKQGEWVYYDANGQIRLKENYNMDVLHGPAVTLSKNGKRLEEGSYVDGERDGTWKTWDEFGTALSEINYRDGVFHGMCKINYANGRPQTVGMYDTGKENGYWKSFMEDGMVQTTRQFDHGELLKEIHENGPVLLTFSDGRPKEEFEVVNQLKTGPFREWHDTGEWIIEESLDPETGDPIRKRTLSGEAIRREGEFVDGKLDGDVYNYGLNGRLLLIERYENGTLISSEKQ